MEKVKEKDALDSIIKLLSKFLTLKEGERDDFADGIEDYVSFGLMEYNEEFDEFSEETKDAMDPLLNMHNWKGSGVHYGKEIDFGMKDVEALLKRLKKLRAEL